MLILFSNSSPRYVCSVRSAGYALTSVRRPGGFLSAGYALSCSAGYALSSVRRPGGFAIRRQKMS